MDDHLNPFGYPCGAHVHATPTAREACQSDEGRPDEPIDGCVGESWTP